MSAVEYHPTPTPAPPPKPSHDPFAGLSLRGGEGAGGFEDDGDTSDEEAPPSRQRGAAGRSSGGRQNDASRDTFQPGAIVRVKLQNFVTYEKAEFFLGPNLNMVIGPNGTGKSSLVCAICLGLGYPSSVLGRASAFGDFVKHGKEEAVLEVELQKKPEDQQNYIVGLCIKKEDNSRKFAINNNRATLKDVQNLMKTLRIQIDNLCQFLPQDKVAEFAGLTPIELLEKTLQAAAPAEMTEWQSELKESYKRQVEAKRLAGASSEHLRILQARQQALQADVEKLQERERIMKKLDEQKTLLLFLRYQNARNEYREAKIRVKDAQKRLKRLQTSSAPSLQAVNHKQDYQAQVQGVAEHRKGKVAEAEAAADEAAALVDAAEAKCQELVTRIEAEEKGFTTKRQALAVIRREITALEARYAQKPRDFDAAEWNQKIVCPPLPLPSLSSSQS
jgi:chromosome segregation ATPase